MGGYSHFALVTFTDVRNPRILPRLSSPQLPIVQPAGAPVFTHSCSLFSSILLEET
jgi:hypothetical protein